MNKELLLSNQICFLVYRLDREIQARYRPLLDTLGVTYPQYLVLLVLWEYQSLEVGKLCTILGLDTGTISPLLKRMQNAGLIQKIRSRKDERVVTILLTEKGKNLQEEALKIPKQIYACLFKESEEYVALKQLLSTYVSRLSSS